jgi:hypothetical protein
MRIPARVNQHAEHYCAAFQQIVVVQSTKSRSRDGHPQGEGAGVVEKSTGKRSRLLFVHPETGKEIRVTVYGYDAGGRGTRILRDAGVE